MRDPRVSNLAQILVRYSTKVSEGDTCVIEGPTAAEPLIAAVYEEVLAAGGHPIVAMAFEGQPAVYFRNASDAQLEWVSPLSDWAAEEADCRMPCWVARATPITPRRRGPHWTRGTPTGR